jgi:hypothetical protein
MGSASLTAPGRTNSSHCARHFAVSASQAAQGQGIVHGHGAERVRREDHRDPHPPRERRQLAGGLGQRDPVAGIDQGAARGSEQVHHAPHDLRVAAAARADALAPRGGIGDLDVGFFLESASSRPTLPCPQSPKTHGTFSRTRYSTMTSPPFRTDRACVMSAPSDMTAIIARGLGLSA